MVKELSENKRGIDNAPFVRMCYYNRLLLRSQTLLIVGFLSLLLSPAHAANWYVDPLAMGSNNGTSWPNAWTSFSSIVWGSSGVKAGDTLYLSGGGSSQTYTNTLTIGASGTSGSPITIMLDANNPAHNGMVVFDFSSTSPKCTASGIVLQKSYVTINGNVNGVAHMMITNMYNSSAIQGCYSINNYGTATTGVKLYYINTVWCNNGFALTYSTQFEIAHCNFTHILGDSCIMTIQSSGTFDANLIYSNLFSANWGPDKIQCGSGTSMFGNTFIGTYVSDPVVSGQHPDAIQCAGNYLKIYNNDFIDCLDSDIDFDCWAITSPHDIWIYNNVFKDDTNRIPSSLDAYPDYIRVYKSTSGGVVSLTNWKILNNTFVDNPNWDAVSFGHYFTWGSPTGSGNEIKNNLFYNCGSSSSFRALYIAASSGYISSTWALDGNIYYYPSVAGAYVAVNGSVQTASSWVAANEPHGKTNAVAFVDYTPFAAGNDYHLASTDTAARNSGVNLSVYFTTDKDGVARPSGGLAWDIGAYQFVIASANLTPPWPPFPSIKISP
jgi:hypothetical protein